MKINDYVERSRKNKISDENIKKNLLASGWKETEVNSALGIKSDSKNLAIIALVLAFLFPIAGLIIGIVALNKIGQGEGRGMAKTAVILSIIMLILPFIFWMMIGGIALLGYSGALDPEQFLPERCQFLSGIDCIDNAAITQNDITMVLRNNIGYEIKIGNVKSEQCTGNVGISKLQGSYYTLDAAPNIMNKEAFKVKVDGCNNKDKVIDTITIDFLNIASQKQNTAVGDIRGKVS